MTDWKTSVGGRFLLRFTLVAVCVFSLLIGKSYGQGGASFDGQVIKADGTLASFATVLVCPYTATGIPCTPTASIWSDLALTHSLPNPTTTDQYGNFTFFAESGVYILQISVGNGIVYSYVVTAGTCPGCVQLNPTGNQVVTQPDGTSLTVNIFNSESGNLNGTLGATTPNTVAGTTGDFSGDVTAPTFIGNLTGNATTASALQNAPTVCPSNQFSTGIEANGNSYCATITGAALPTPTPTTLGGVFSSSAPTNEFATGINTSGAVTYAQPTYANLGGTVPTWNQNTTGNAATATALAATPTNCGSTIPAYGISANGNALCTSSTAKDAYVTASGCTFGSDGNGLYCSVGSVSFTPTFPDTSYTVSCIANFSTTMMTTESALPALFVSAYPTTTSTFTVDEALNNGSSVGYGIAANYGVTVQCHAHHN